ncbi:hypothetical protein EON79_13715 [bacterium]|nr:MAG: hypothetical protein EON79_13715 [bacterium]
MNAKTVFALALTATAALSSAQVTKQGSGYLFRYKFTKGSTYKCVATVGQAVAAAQANQLKVTIPFSQKVTAVTGDTASLSFSMGPITMNGNPLSQKPVATTGKMSRLGKLIGADKGGSPGLVVFPSGPVAPGATWSAAFPLGAMGAMGGGGGNATAKYKFIGMKTIDGKPTAELAVTLASTGETKISGGGRTFVSVADGLMVKSNMTLNIASPQIQNQGAPSKVTINIQRVK